MRDSPPDRRPTAALPRPIAARPPPDRRSASVLPSAACKGGLEEAEPQGHFQDGLQGALHEDPGDVGEDEGDLRHQLGGGHAERGRRQGSTGPLSTSQSAAHVLACASLRRQLWDVATGFWHSGGGPLGRRTPKRLECDTHTQRRPCAAYELAHIRPPHLKRAWRRRSGACGVTLSWALSLRATPAQRWSPCSVSWREGEGTAGSQIWPPRRHPPEHHGVRKTGRRRGGPRPTTPAVRSAQSRRALAARTPDLLPLGMRSK